MTRGRRAWWESSADSRAAASRRRASTCPRATTAALVALVLACSPGCRDTPDSTHDLPAAFDPDGLRTLPQLAAHAGPWMIPDDVRAAGERQWVRYDSPPPWEGGRNCGGTFHAGTRELAEYLVGNFEASSYGGYSCRQNTASPGQTSVHGTGRAIDLFVRLDGGQADNDRGDPIGAWLIRNASQIGVQYIIWDRWQWNGSRSGRKDRAYGGPHPHHDHLHIELNHDGAARRTPWFDGGGDPPCSHDCSSGARRCRGGGWQQCGDYDGDPCREWGGGGACDGRCFSDGRCCSEGCSSGSRRCVGSGYQVCGDHDGDPCREWGGGGACGGACWSDGRCCDHDCARGERECVDGADFRACGDHDADPCREWSGRQSCDGTCWGAGQCCSNQCELGALRCLDDGWQECGDWDDDPCTEWGAGAPCGPGAVCMNDGECLDLPEDCANGIDDDASGLADCEDPVCEPAFVCWSPEDCQNGEDDDFDGAADCLDDDCANSIHCWRDEICDNGIDDDRDGLTDCDDPACVGALRCVHEGFEDCANEADDDGDGQTDCFDDDCTGALRCEEGLVDPGECVDAIDNDGDGLADCDDPACDDTLFCSPETDPWHDEIAADAGAGTPPPSTTEPDIPRYPQTPDATPADARAPAPTARSTAARGCAAGR